MFQVGWIADYPDPENLLDIPFHSDSNNNFTGYDNPEVDSLLEKARVETDRKLRFIFYNQAEELILRDAPLVPLWPGSSGYLLVKPYVKDYSLTPIVVPKLRHVYFTEE